MSIKVKGKPSLQGKFVPHIVVKNGVEAVELYRKALGAEELYRSTLPNGSFIHAELLVFGAVLMVAEENPQKKTMRSPASLGGSSVTLDMYVDDVDRVVARAVAAGAEVAFPVADMFWGDRYGQVIDPDGHVWAFSTLKEEITPEDVKQRMLQFFSGQQKNC